MNTPEEEIREQLSAWMDGELPVAQARFLERRLGNDLLLRRQLERLQIASSCLKGQALRPMSAGLAPRIGSMLEQPVAITETRRGLSLRRALAASVAVLALALAPGVLRNGLPDHFLGNAAISPPVANLVPSPASADLVAKSVASRVAVAASAQLSPAASSYAVKPLLAANPGRSQQESPLPLDRQSPADFPLVETAVQKSWPRSPLNGGSDPALEAYLVRHNQMLSNDGLGGFMPYMDVIADDREQLDGKFDGADGR